MRKNGFTLIELLAVIVILAIIAVIAVPIVLNIIDETKNNAGLRSAEMYVKAAELSIAQATLKNKNITDGEYNIKDGNICLKADCTNKIDVEVNGEVPKEGTITITNGNISNLSIKLNEKEIYKNLKGELVYFKYLEEVCEFKEGTQKTAGAKYECKVDPNKDAYTFYVLTTPNATDTSINLIMDRNMCSDGTPTNSTKENKCLVAWMSKTDYADDVNYGTYGNNNKGPITAMDYLYNATKTWKNTNEMTIDKFDNDAGSKFDMQTYNTYARLPYYSEVSSFDNNNGYLYENLDGDYWYHDESTNHISSIYGYWTLSSLAGDSSSAWNVISSGSLGGNLVGNGDSFGVRAVITLKI